uniref:Innexin n=1 Tax=Panagrellus redivivus TaxID=6233 RepID=A0A7E4V9U2_PANRE
MMIPALQKIVENLKPRYDDDGIDRLNYAYTTGLFAALIVIIGAKQYVGEPLQCWIPAEYKGSWEMYIESYCFVENTYHVNPTAPGIPDQTERHKTELSYYQWVPMVLTLQLLMFMLPKAFWAAMSWRSGFNVRSVIGQSKSAGGKNAVVSDETGEKAAREAADYIELVVLFNNVRKDKCFGFFPPALHQRFLTITYLVYKFLNCVNSIGQLYLMNHFLNTSYTFWGIGILTDVLSDRTWKESGHFPRVTYCDFMRRDDTSGRPMDAIVQCVLMINMFNEKIYILIWFWFVILSMLNIINFIFWAVTSNLFAYRNGFVEDRLSFCRVSYHPASIRSFTESYLPPDAITALRLIRTNAGNRVAAQIVKIMYENWKHQEYLKQPKLSKPNDKLNGSPLEKPMMMSPASSLENTYSANPNNAASAPEKEPLNEEQLVDF